MYKKIILAILVFFFAFNIGMTVYAQPVYTESLTNKTTSSKGCEGLFGDVKDKNSIAYWLQEIFTTIKWVAPVLVLFFSVVEFLKATASQDKDALTKATKKTGKRLVIALVLFLLPSLINWLFPLLGWYGTCGIQ